MLVRQRLAPPGQACRSSPAPRPAPAARRRRSMAASPARAAASPGAPLSEDDKVLLLGITGVTGRCALEGLLAGGLRPSQLVAVSRNPGGAAARAVAARGVEVVAGDLDAPASLAPHLAAARGVYVHALSGDAASADPAELVRARALAGLLAAAGGRLALVAYNSSAGRGAGAGISQMDQKHAVEDVLLGSGAPGVMLGATMFMEEFWKRYTRPGLVGRQTFTFSLPGDRPLQLVAARDVGLAAATALTSADPGAWAGRKIALAGDELTPRQMCEAFSRAQGGAPVKHSCPPAWLFWFLSRDLWRITTFLRDTGFEADVAACRRDFPGLLTFDQFLAATRWGDAGRTYEDGIAFDGALPARAEPARRCVGAAPGHRRARAAAQAPSGSSGAAPAAAAEPPQPAAAAPPAEGAAAASSSSSSSSTSAAAAAVAAAAGVAPPAPAPSGVSEQPLVSPKAEATLSAAQYREIYDRLIAIFQERPRDDWKKLIVFSKQWGQHKSGVLDRIRSLADGEADVDKKMRLRRLFRSLQGVDEEVSRYNDVLAKFLAAQQEEWEAVVAVYRGDLQKPFFQHLQCLVAAAKDDKARKEELVLINTRLLALVTAHDSVAADTEKLEAAAEVYRDLLSSISSVEDADAKMAALAEAGKIDPAFLQISARAYGAARDTNMTLDEAKWVSYRLYVRARDYFDRQQPKEKRILEYLVSMRDRGERSRQLDAAVTPGPTRYTDSHDYLFSTPARLYAVLEGTLRAYDAMNAAASARMGAGGEDNTPWKIAAMRELRDEIRRRYL
ncbi:hypothetical protein HT031_006594 [Scenedesmus sp. PABB004]|nr:hypothetical protein HT031_006594 [Scenedesmus sp. PABB004]